MPCSQSQHIHTATWQGEVACADVLSSEYRILGMCKHESGAKWLWCLSNPVEYVVIAVFAVIDLIAIVHLHS